MLRPNLPYRCFFSSSISSWIVSSVPLSTDTSSSILSVELDSNSNTSGCGSDTKQSPILYLFTISNGLIFRGVGDELNENLISPQDRYPICWKWYMFALCARCVPPFHPPTCKIKRNKREKYTYGTLSSSSTSSNSILISSRSSFSFYDPLALSSPSSTPQHHP